MSTYKKNEKRRWGGGGGGEGVVHGILSIIRSLRMKFEFN